VGLSLPNVSKLVPNVGRILRKGTGIPSPDAPEPRASTPKVKARSQSASCS
jgi:hypothetical protein